jgi:hypothetical protein
MINRQDLTTIHAIADRAVALYLRLGLLEARNKFARYGIAHELMTVHGEIVPLRLAEMLAADDSNFAHDIGGIHRHLDDAATPPRLRDCFLPRFANV